MEELQELFGDGALSYADFEAKVAEAGLKLANLKGGGYVDKGKYDKLAGEYAKYKQGNDVSKYADYDTIKTELEQLKAEKADNELMRQVVEAGVDTKFRKFVMTEVKGSVTKDKDFKKCLSEYLEQNPQFVENPSRRGVFKSSQDDPEKGSGSGAKNLSQKMNAYLRGAR